MLLFYRPTELDVQPNDGFGTLLPKEQLDVSHHIVLQCYYTCLSTLNCCRPQCIQFDCTVVL